MREEIGMPSSTEETVPASSRGRYRRRVLIALRAIVSLAVILANLWAVAALAIDVPITWLRLPLALLLAGMVIGIHWRFGWSWLTRALGAGCFLAVLGWWLLQAPTDDRAWQADVAVKPHAAFDGGRVAIHGIRSCRYRSESDYDVHHHDKEVDLADLRTADLFLVYWGAPAIAHTMVSFGFADGDFLCFSIEARKEEGESYSAIKGFFRQFELIFVIAEESDLVGLRAIHRQEEVYLYRLRMTPDEVRILLIGYLHDVNQLHRDPAWYNAVTSNCTTAIPVQRRGGGSAPWDWRILLNGHLDGLLHQRGLISNRVPLAELRRRSLINAHAGAVAPGDDFSQSIRRGLPAGDP